MQIIILLEEASVEEKENALFDGSPVQLTGSTVLPSERSATCTCPGNCLPSSPVSSVLLTNYLGGFFSVVTSLISFRHSSAN